MAQAAALERPDLVRRLIVAASTPGAVPAQPATEPRVWKTAAHERNDDDDFLYLFFPDSDGGRRRGIESLRRLDRRIAQPAHVEVRPEAWQAQFAAIGRFHGLWDRLDALRMPTLIATGAHDVMVPAHASYAMAQRLTNAKLVLYSDAGHGFLFQHHEDFAREANAFLAS